MVPSGTVVSTIELLIRQCGFTKSRKVLSKSGFGYTINCMASFISELSFVLKGKFSTTEIKHLLSHCLHIITSYCLTVCTLSPPLVSLSANYHLLLSHCLYIITSYCLTVCTLSPHSSSQSVITRLSQVVVHLSATGTVNTSLPQTRVLCDVLSAVDSHTVTYCQL